MNTATRRQSDEAWRARGITVVARVALLAAILGMCAVQLPAVRVSAAPPSLTASENPLVIPFSQDTKTFTVSWNSGSASTVELHGNLNNQPEAGWYPGPAVGSVPITLHYGDKWVVQMYKPGKTELLATLTVTTKRPDIKIDLGVCVAQQCIKDVDVEPHGTFANFRIKAVMPAKIILEASEKGTGTFASGTFNLGMAADWHTFLQNLKPNTEYTYTVKATDEKGNVQTKSGSFKTLKRQVTVTFSAVKVINDSDDLSEGEITFFYFINGSHVGATDYSENTVDDGETRHPNWSKTITNAPDSLAIKVQGADDDEICVVSCNNYTALGPQSSDHGSDSSADWATASGTYQLPSGTEEVKKNEPFSIETTAHALQFRFTGTYTVTYVP